MGQLSENNIFYNTAVVIKYDKTFIAYFDLK